MARHNNAMVPFSFAVSRPTQQLGADCVQRSTFRTNEKKGCSLWKAKVARIDGSSDMNILFNAILKQQNAFQDKLSIFTRCCLDFKMLYYLNAYIS